MAKLLLLLVSVCFQFSFQEELKTPDLELIRDETPVNVQLLDGEDKNQWHYQKDDNDVEPLDDILENEWKYEKEDYDDDYDWIEGKETLFELLEELLYDSGEEIDRYKKIMNLFKRLDEEIPHENKPLDKPDGDRMNVLSVIEDPTEQGEEGPAGMYKYAYLYLLRLRETLRNNRRMSKRFSSV